MICRRDPPLLGCHGRRRLEAVDHANAAAAGHNSRRRRRCRCRPPVAEDALRTLRTDAAAARSSPPPLLKRSNGGGDDGLPPGWRDVARWRASAALTMTDRMRCCCSGRPPLTSVRMTNGAWSVLAAVAAACCLAYVSQVFRFRPHFSRGGLRPTTAPPGDDGRGGGGSGGARGDSPHRPLTGHERRPPSLRGRAAAIRIGLGYYCGLGRDGLRTEERSYSHFETRTDRGDLRECFAACLLSRGIVCPPFLRHSPRKEYLTLRARAEDRGLRR